jgi:hypothetical protein
MSARNNEDRFGSSSHETPTQPVMAETQQQTSFVVSTELVQLPSKGKYYPEGHPLHNKDQVEIRYMTAKDEDILTNKSFIKNNIVLDKLLESVLVDKTISVPSLLIGDRTALIVAARISGYGADYSTKVVCPSCGDVASFTFDLNESINTVSADHMGVEYDTLSNGNFVLTLPKSNAKVEVRPLTGEDESFLNKTNKMRQKNNLPELSLTDQMKQYIVALNGNADRTFINSTVDLLPALDARYIRLNYSKVVPNIELTQEYECQSCGYEQEMEVPFTTDFFWPE